MARSRLVNRTKTFSRFEMMGRAWRFCVADQVDIAVDLGAVAPPLPEILSLEQFAAIAPEVPPQMIERDLRTAGASWR